MSLLIEHEIDSATRRRGTRRFLLLSLLIIVALVTAMLVRQGLFRHSTKLSFVADTAQDISKGQAVQIAGFRVGAVTSVSLRDDSRVVVEVEVDSGEMHLVTHDARIELRKEGLVGSAKLEIIPGPDKTRLATSESRLAFTRADGLGALANQVRDEFVPILRDIKAITGTLADPATGLPATLAQIRGTTQSLNGLLQNGDRQVGEIGGGATRVLGAAETSLGHLGRTLETTNKQLPELLDRAQRVLQHTETISAEAAASVPPALRDGSATAADVRDIVRGAKQTWPISTMVDGPGPSRIRTDSDPRAEGGGASNAGN